MRFSGESVKSESGGIHRFDRMKKLHSLKRTAAASTEHQAQVAIFQWAELQSRATPDLELLHAIPNGGLRNVIVARKMKAEGVKAGVPDMCLPAARGGWHGLYIELKRESAKPIRGGKGGVSDDQFRWIQRLIKNGYFAKICYGSREAIEAIQEYLTLPLSGSEIEDDEPGVN